MLIDRRAALSFLLARPPACDSKPEPGDGADDDGEEVAASAEEGEVEEEEPVVEEEEEKVDFGRAGQACDQSVLSASCRTGGVDGAEFCVYDLDIYDYVWTGCLTESCGEAGASRACEGGVQYCASYAAGVDIEAKRWGACGAAGECEPGQTQSCFGEGEGEEFGDITMSCTIDENGRPMWNWEDCNTPLVLSFGDEVAFDAAPMAAADFDVAGAACVRADWPTPATPWLALDRDGDGQIAGGQELFGSATRLSAGTGPHNGFQALAELDSDRDGKVSPADARWNELVLWADHDADRRSTQWELLPLASFEIVEIDLGYTDRPSCDAQGNCARERAAFVYRNGGVQRSGEVIDVRVSCE